MTAQSPSHRGFSLIEVTLAVSVIAFALVSLLGLVPLGLTNSRACQSETRAAELAHTVFATIAAEPFTAAPCFSRSEKVLDFGKLGSEGAEAKPVLLYASYDARRAFPLIMRGPEVPPEMSGNLEIYRLELHSEPDPVPGTVPPKAFGSTVRLQIFLSREHSPVYATSTYIGSFRKNGILVEAQP